MIRQAQRPRLLTKHESRWSSTTLVSTVTAGRGAVTTRPGAAAYPRATDAVSSTRDRPPSAAGINVGEYFPPRVDTLSSSRAMVVARAGLGRRQQIAKPYKALTPAKTRESRSVPAPYAE